MNDTEKDEILKNFGKYEYTKRNKDDKVYWVKETGIIGEPLISFDKETVYNLFLDYPHNMTEKEVEQFDKENPEWAELLADRKKTNRKGGD